MKMGEDKTSFSRRVFVASAAELFLVAALVFAIGWAGVHLGAAVHQRPVGPNDKNVIALGIAQSDRQGEVKFDEGAGYAGWWRCSGVWSVGWKIAPRQTGRYHLEARLANPEQKADGRIEVMIGDQLIEKNIAYTGGPTNWNPAWKTIDLGSVSLKSLAYAVNIRPAPVGGQTNLYLKSISLRLEEPMR
jgi:hypothetical protein